MNKQTLGIDLEGVLCDGVERWLIAVNQKYGIHVRKDEILGHLLDHKDLNRVTYDDYIGLWKQMWESDSKSIKLEDQNAPTVIARLRERYNIYIITASIARQEHIEGWLKHNGVPYDRIVKIPWDATVDSRKKIAHGSKMLPDVDIYVDDFFAVLKEAVENGKKGILFMQSWNLKHARDATTLGIRMARDWNDVERILSGKGT